MQVFGPKNIHLIDGANLVSNPGEEFELIENFIGVKNELKFRLNETRGFYCLDRPIPMCLPDGKGNVCH